MKLLSPIIRILQFYERFDELSKYIIVHKIAKFNCFAKIITYSKYQDNLLQSYIYVHILTLFDMGFSESSVMGRRA